MGTAVQPNFNRRFAVPAGILDDGSQAAIEVTLETDADVVLALAANSPFPQRPTIELGRIKANASTGRNISFSDGGARISAKASARVASGMGIYPDSANALKALTIEDAPGLDLTLAPSDASHRYLAMSWGYEVQGSVDGEHPIGALGTLTFGVEARRDSVFAVLHRFANEEGAQDVVARCARSWQLPRQVKTADDLAPGTWLLAETEGSLSLNAGAQVGYDFSFLRDSKKLGLTGDIGFKLDANVSATLGFDVSGRYLVMLGREDESEKLRLKVLKLNKKGHSFGLNLAVGVKGVVDAAPDHVDDFVKAVFGVHGRQVVKDLLAIEKATSVEDLSDAVAGLVNQTGLDLLKQVTGVDPAVSFGEAREKALTALRAWDSLPERVAAATWSAIEKATGPELDQLAGFLKRVADRDDLGSAANFAEAISAAGNGAIPNAGPAVAWLNGIADRGLLSLLDRVDEVRQTAEQVSNILTAGVIQKLQGFIAERLQLERVRNAVTKADFQALDGWLVQRLSMFLDQDLGFDRLEEVKNTINTVVRKRQSVYQAAKKALEKRYSVDFAAAYSRTTTRTAVLDVSFDVSKPGVSEVMQTVLKTANIDRLLAERVDGIVLHTALLTHGIERQSTVELNMPFLSFRRDHISKSLAQLEAQDQGSRVAVYSLDASDTVTVRNRLRSQLAVSASLPLLRSGTVRIGDATQATWSYEYVSVHDNMRRSDLEARVTPFILQYLPDVFARGGAGSLDTWISDLDRAVEDVVANGSNEFGDAILTMDVSVPGRALQAWFRNRSTEQLAQDCVNVSRALQRALKQLIPFYYLQDVDRLRQNPTVAALLTWAAIPPSTSARLANGTLTLDMDTDVFWDFSDVRLRRAMAHRSATTSALAPMLAAAHKRLMDAGQKREADFFVASEGPDFQMAATNETGDRLLVTLLAFESRVVRQAVSALRDVSEFVTKSGGGASDAIDRLAEMGSDITEAFHGGLTSVYGGDSLRTLGSLVFLESARVLDSSLRATRPSAMLRIQVLKEKRSFLLKNYLNGERPDEAEIAVTQTLTSVAVP